MYVWQFGEGNVLLYNTNTLTVHLYTVLLHCTVTQLSTYLTYSMCSAWLHCVRSKLQCCGAVQSEPQCCGPVA